MLSLMIPRRRAVNIDDDRMWSDFRGGTKTIAGVHVSEDAALAFSTVFLCTRIISEPIGTLPIREYERKDGDDRSEVKGSNVAMLLNFAPNEDMTASVFRESRTAQQLNWSGGGFAEIVRHRRTGEVVEMWPIHASRVEPDKTGKFAYAVRGPDGEVIGMRRDEMLHVPGTLSDDGIWSKGIIQYARETIGGALATDQHGWQYFGSGAQPKGVVMTPGLKQREDRRDFRKEWKELHGSPDSSEVVILPKESSYTPITVSNQDNQFIESREFNRKVICELYRVPLYMISERIPAGANLEAQGADFIMYTLFPWVKKWEEQLNRKLLPREKWGTHFFEHDFSSLLRGDLQTRMNSYRVGISTGVFTINHCLRLENLPGIGPAGDVHYVPANLATAGQMEHGNPTLVPGGAKRPPGSDHTGSPADNPLDHDPKAFHEWMKSIPKLAAQELQSQLASMESRLDDRKTEWQDVARSVLEDTLSRMLHKEANAAQRAADGKSDFDAWAREFYAKHETMLSSALRPACNALRVAGLPRWCDSADLAAWLRSASERELMASFDRDTREVFGRKLAAWPTERAAQLAEAIIRGET